MMKFTVHYVPHTHYDAEVFLTRDETFEIGYSVRAGRAGGDAGRSGVQVRAGPDLLHRAVPEGVSGGARLRRADDPRRSGWRSPAGCTPCRTSNIPSGEVVHPAGAGGQVLVREGAGGGRALRLAAGYLRAAPADSAAHGRSAASIRTSSSGIGTFDGPTEYWWKGLDGTRLFCHWMRDQLRGALRRSGQPARVPEVR